ncbi:hypothetical protein UPF0251 [Gottschalkia acidurici 9a]|uniref:UPF0251 protein Curi_c04180 n=1 Tax=Gottschalkia acidurici (strain ATCC 7906 / DSM 604 / BCRC 14475 / CIP 104303 / KCTC 5404 / NCIMB 10678 / 9a) TaxID=1128398 RepID=K0AUG2_GOTA9|nr:DUF134 domain-containing protein [Gottschalkia acidurici]AFS77493.1 hypothetical protein UPF0251 [Gottschalkia acidurici 9a]
MARPKKCRRVEFFPENTSFIPLGKPKCSIESVTLKIEELEAIRLKDMEGLNQEECAKSMEVSRQTFQNIIYNAHKKIAIALTEGKAIEISGGHYTTGDCKFKCKHCGKTYDISYEQDRDSCPSCGSEEVLCNKNNKQCHKWCESI